MPATDGSPPRGWDDVFGRRGVFALDPEGSPPVGVAVAALPLPWRRGGPGVADPALATTVGGVPLANPVGLASGFDKACERLGPLGAPGFGYAVGGTITLRPRPGNARPRIARDPALRSIVNAMGLPN